MGNLEGMAAMGRGGARGIARPICLALAHEGPRVAIADILLDNAQSVCREIEAGGGKAVALQVDLTKRAEVERMVEAALGAFGQLNILVNNAGWDKLEFVLDSEEETWEKVLAINFKSVIYTCKAVLPHMVAQNGGKVVNVASDAGRVGSLGEAVYAGAKGAIIAFSKSLAREMARYRINVNVVCPGLTETPLLEKSRSEMPNVVEAIGRSVPLRRLGEPEDVARAVAFLASPAADYITGQTLSVSGGLTMA